jgi:hypothetical protein
MIQTTPLNALRYSAHKSHSTGALPFAREHTCHEKPENRKPKNMLPCVPKNQNNKKKIKKNKN